MKILIIFVAGFLFCTCNGALSNLTPTPNATDGRVDEPSSGEVYIANPREMSSFPRSFPGFLSVQPHYKLIESNVISKPVPNIALLKKYKLTFMPEAYQYAYVALRKFLLEEYEKYSVRFYDDQRIIYEVTSWVIHLFQQIYGVPQELKDAVTKVFENAVFPYLIEFIGSREPQIELKEGETPPNFVIGTIDPRNLRYYDVRKDGEEEIKRFKFIPKLLREDVANTNEPVIALCRETNEPLSYTPYSLGKRTEYLCKDRFQKFLYWFTIIKETKVVTTDDSAEFQRSENKFTTEYYLFHGGSRTMFYDFYHVKKIILLKKNAPHRRDPVVESQPEEQPEVDEKPKDEEECSEEKEAQEKKGGAEGSLPETQPQASPEASASGTTQDEAAKEEPGPQHQPEP